MNITTTPAPDRMSPVVPSIWSTGLRAAVAAAAATELFATIARIAGVPMRAGGIGADAPQSLPPGWVALATAFCTVLGVGLAVLLRRLTSRPRWAFLIAACLLTLLSFVSPIGAGATTLATKLTLGFAHVIAAAIVIPIVANRLPVTRTPRQRNQLPRRSRRTWPHSLPTNRQS
jgi:hypothetical protein